MTNYKLTAAKALATAFEQRHRDNGESFWCLADESPEWMAAAVHSAHDDRLPNDIDYSACSEVADAIVEALEGDEDLDDARSERIDGLVPVYNNERLTWLASHLDRPGYCDEACAEFGLAQDADLMSRIGSGMYLWYGMVWDALLAAIEEQADELEEAAE